MTVMRQWNWDFLYAMNLNWAFLRTISDFIERAGILSCNERARASLRKNRSEIASEMAP